MVLAAFGAAGQIRTADLVITNDALYRLSYSSILPYDSFCIISQVDEKSSIIAKIFKCGGAKTLLRRFLGYCHAKLTMP